MLTSRLFTGRLLLRTCIENQYGLVPSMALVTDLDHVDSSDLVLDDLPSLLRKTRGVVISQEMALQLV